MFLAFAGALPAAAQVRGSVRLGATWTSALVKDQIVASPITVKTGLAPTLTIGASLPSGKRYRIGMEALFTTSSLRAQEPGQTGDLGSLRTATLLLTAEGPTMVSHLHWRAGIGLIKYLPSDHVGLFQLGGPTRFIGSIGAEYVRPWKPGWEWLAGIRYSYHGFSTATLAARGFSQSESVHRVWLEAGVARYFQ